MSSFEKEYYETDSFWDGAMLQDEANKKRIELTAELVNGNVRSLVDVGCGNGIFTNYLLKTRPEVNLTGIDRSASALRFVKVNKIQASIEALPIENEKYDCVTCLEVIEHLPENIYQKSLDELTRISNKYVIISVPYRERLEDSYNKCPNCKSIFNYELHLRSFDESIMQNLLHTRGFKCTKMVTTGKGISYWGHKTYQKIFYPEQLLAWNSPICPICGYSEKKQDTNIQNYNPEIKQEQTAPRKLVSYISYLPKLFWPKISKDYWIIARYEKISAK